MSQNPIIPKQVKQGVLEKPNQIYYPAIGD
jgi:hypothetical protein